MIRPVERKSGVRFEVFIQAGGRKKYVGTFESKRAAMDAEQDAEVLQRKIERGEAAPAIDAKRTFGAAVGLWLAKLDESKSRSHDEYDGRATNYLLPRFGPVSLVAIRRNDVIQWRDELAERVSASTVNTVMGTLSAAFAWCIDRDWLEHNPCHGVKRLKPDVRVFPWLDSTEAITRLIGECPEHIRNVVAVLVGTGMRLDEALHLRWDDIDLEHRLITVHRGRRGKGPTGTTKSGKARRVPIFDTVLGVLKAMKLTRGASSLLWPGGYRRLRGTSPERALSQAAVRDPFKLAVVRAGLPRELRLHDLRHTFASLFLVDGGDIFKLSRILGHNSVSITERTYAHLKPTAFAEDYGRVSFRMPSESNVVPLRAMA
ncbi:MAG: tyrosine-type recombinase/integrase [Kofleriaceae bacterium]